MPAQNWSGDTFRFSWALHWHPQIHLLNNASTTLDDSFGVIGHAPVFAYIPSMLMRHFCRTSGSGLTGATLTSTGADSRGIQFPDPIDKAFLIVSYLPCNIWGGALLPLTHQFMRQMNTDLLLPSHNILLIDQMRATSDSRFLCFGDVPPCPHCPPLIKRALKFLWNWSNLDANSWTYPLHAGTVTDNTQPVRYIGVYCSSVLVNYSHYWYALIQSMPSIFF